MYNIFGSHTESTNFWWKYEQSHYVKHESSQPHLMRHELD